MNCPQCGGFAPKTAIKCPACGASMKAAQPKPAAAAAPKRAKAAGPQDDLVKAALADRDAKQTAARGSVPPGRNGPPAGPPPPRRGSGALYAIGPDGKPLLGPDGKPVPAVEEPVVYTAPAAARSKNLKAKLVRDATTAAIVVAVGVAAFFSPPGRAAYGSWLMHRALGGLTYTKVSAHDFDAGSAQLDLPDGSSSVTDEKLHASIYRFDKDLPLGNGHSARVAFDVVGYQGTLEDALKLATRFDPMAAVVNETHMRKKFRSVQYVLPTGDNVDHGGQRACYYQLADRDETVFGVVIYYDDLATDPKAMDAVLDHVLGSVQE